MAGRRLGLTALLIAGLGALLLAGQLARPAADGAGAIVLVSGRDDHGLLQQAELPLVTQPDGADVVAHVPDGTFAEVLEARGTWLHIRSLTDPSATGWIDDFHLRGRAVLHNSQQVSFVDAQAGNPVRVQVRLVNGEADPIWVEAQHLTEVGADVEPHEH